MADWLRRRYVPCAMHERDSASLDLSCMGAFEVVTEEEMTLLEQLRKIISLRWGSCSAQGRCNIRLEHLRIPPTGPTSPAAICCTYCDNTAKYQLRVSLYITLHYSSLFMNVIFLNGIQTCRIGDRQTCRIGDRVPMPIDPW